MQTFEILSALSGILTAIGVWLAACQLRRTRKQSVTTFEDSLTVQYRQIAATLPLTALLGEALTDKEHDAHLQYFYRYFDLCNEQAFLQKTGRVSVDTWEFWKDGILTNLRRPAFAKAWEEIARRATDDFSELRLLSPINTEHPQLSFGEIMSDTSTRTEALEIAFRELVAMLGRTENISVTQLAGALENAATAQKASAESKAALAELARRLRNP